MIVTMEALWDAFWEFDACDTHSKEEGEVLTKLFNIAASIDAGMTAIEAVEMHTGKGSGKGE